MNSNFSVSFQIDCLSRLSGMPGKTVLKSFYSADSIYHFLDMFNLKLRTHPYPRTGYKMLQMGSVISVISFCNSLDSVFYHSFDLLK